MSQHYRWDVANARRNIAASIGDSLAIEDIVADVSEVGGTYTITLDHNNAFVLSEFLTALRDAQVTRIKDVM